MAEVYGNIYVETDYSKFKYLLGNRNLTETRKKKIMNSIKKVGYVMNPIIVNEKMEIIDGQGRHAACKELGLPIYYVVAEGASTDECINLNIGQTNWGITDYVKFYADGGNENYKQLMQLINTYPEIMPAHIVGISHGTLVHGGRASDLRNGNFHFHDSFAETNQILQLLASNLHTIDLIPGSKRLVYSCLAWIIRYCNVDTDRLFKQIARNYMLIPPVSDKHSMYFIEQIERLYNKNLRTDSIIYMSHIYKVYLRAAKAKNCKHGLNAKEWREQQILSEGA